MHPNSLFTKLGRDLKYYRKVLYIVKKYNITPEEYLQNPDKYPIINKTKCEFSHLRKDNKKEYEFIRNKMKTYKITYEEFLNNPEKYPTRKRHKYKDRKTYQKYFSLKTNYNMSQEDYDNLHNSQNGLCAICNQPETTKTTLGDIKALSIDHCHDTGKIRGLLCNNCNRSLGMLKDNIEILQNAINYLIKYK